MISKRSVSVATIAMFISSSLFFPQTSNANQYKVTVNLTAAWKYSISNIIEDDGEAAAIESCAEGIINDYDIMRGSKVKLVNESGKTVGLGTFTKVFISYVDGGYGGKDPYCGYRAKFKVQKAKFYSLTIDGRRGPEYSFAELRKKKWKIVLSLGL